LRAAEAGLFEGGDVGIQIFSREPGHFAGFAGPVEEGGVGGLVGERGCAGREGGVVATVAGSGVHEEAHGAADVGLELGFGDAGLLEVEDVEEPALEHGLHHLERRHGAAREVGDAHGDDGAEAVRVKDGGIPGHGGAPIVPGDHGRLFAEGVEEADDITDQVLHAIGLDFVGTLRPP
jgi:hypothetical protein